MTMRKLASLAIMATLLAACSTAPDTAAKRATLHDEAAGTLNDFSTKDSTIKRLLSSAYADAIFPSVTTGAIGIGGAYGRAEVYQRGILVGYADLSQGSIGAQLGGQSYSELILFQNEAAFAAFKSGETVFDARATAVAASEGAAANADYRNGVIVFVAPQGGLMFQASIGGQKFGYEPVTATR